MSIFTMFAKQSMIYQLSNPINRNRSAAKISKLMSSTADKIHVIGVQKTVNPEFRGTPNCLSLALVKSLSVNERVTDITTIGLVLVWCPVLPGVHHFGFYKLIMLLLLLLVQNMAFVSDCNMVRCNWWTEQFLPCHEVLDIATWAKQNIFYNILLATEILTEESNL